jgi:hypothetical protein
MNLKLRARLLELESKRIIKNKIVIEKSKTTPLDDPIDDVVNDIMLSFDELIYNL